MTNTGKLVFKPSKSKQEIASIYNFNVNAFADMKDFDWSEQNIKKEIADGYSLDMVEMMMKMEEEFGVEIPEDKTEDLKTISDVTNFLQNAN